MVWVNRYPLSPFITEGEDTQGRPKVYKEGLKSKKGVKRSGNDRKRYFRRVSDVGSIYSSNKYKGMDRVWDIG